MHVPAPTTFDLQKLKVRHHLIIELILLGKTDIEVGEDLKVTPQMVAYTRRSHLAQQLINARLAQLADDNMDVHGRMRDLAVVAQFRLTEILTDDNIAASKPELMAQVSQDVLSRAGHPKLSAAVQLPSPLSQSMIDDIKARAKMGGNLAESEVLD